MNRAERRARGITKEVSAGIEEAEKIRTVNQYSVAVASVLWDQNKDPDEIRSTMAKIWDRFDSFKRNYATVEDYRMILWEEAGIDFLYCGVGGNRL